LQYPIVNFAKIDTSIELFVTAGRALVFGIDWRINPIPFVVFFANRSQIGLKVDWLKHLLRAWGLFFNLPKFPPDFRASCNELRQVKFVSEVAKLRVAVSNVLQLTLNY
jgi:hypothetical protein